MSDSRTDARPVPVPPSVRELIRRVAPEEDQSTPIEREFSVDGREWVAREVGEAAVGTNPEGAAYLVVVHFEPKTTKGEGKSRETASGRVRRTYLPRGRLELLYDEELIEIFRTTRPR